MKVRRLVEAGPRLVQEKVGASPGAAADSSGDGGDGVGRAGNGTAWAVGGGDTGTSWPMKVRPAPGRATARAARGLAARQTGAAAAPSSAVARGRRGDSRGAAACAVVPAAAAGPAQQSSSACPRMRAPGDVYGWKSVGRCRLQRRHQLGMQLSSSLPGALGIRRRRSEGNEGRPAARLPLRSHQAYTGPRFLSASHTPCFYGGRAPEPVAS